MISETLQGIEGVSTYLDDILVYSTDFDTHLATLEKVFKKLQDNSLYLNLDKCKFAVSELEYLGHSISVNGVKPLHSRVADLKNFPLPETGKQLRRYIGAYSFYHKFLKNCSGVLDPLHKLVATHGRTKTKLVWSAETKAAFENSKKKLCDMILLSYPDPEAKISLQTDASLNCAGCVLQQTLPSGETVPIACFSKTFNKAQQSYSTFDRELLAAYLAVKHFRNFIEGQNAILYTDHRPLIGAIESKREPHSAMQQRYLSYISQYVDKVEYVRGELNFLPDLLSRKIIAAIAKISPGVSVRELAIAQQSDNEISTLLKENYSFNYTYVCVDAKEDLYLLCDVHDTVARPIVPRALRQRVFDAVHQLSHPSHKITSKLIRKRFAWPYMRKDIQAMARSCQACQQSKVGRNTIAPLQPIKTPEVRFSHLHVDVVGPLPPSNGYNYLLTVIDRYTKFMNAVPLKDITTESLIDALLQGWISTFGVPHKIVTDQGSQFTYKLFRDVLCQIGVKHIKTTSYHPIANGEVESLHRRIKASLMTYNAPSDWYFNLPLVLLGLRTAIKSDYDYSAIEMVLGSPVRLPGDYFNPPPASEDWNAHYLMKRLRSFMRNLKAPQTRLPLTRNSYIPKDLANCSHVWLRVRRVKKPLEPPYFGPFLVVARHSKYLTIRRGDKNVNVSLDNVKPAYTADWYDPHSISAIPDPADNVSFPFNDLNASPSAPTPMQRRSARTAALPKRFRDYEIY